eukprot:scaffold19066_cov33-Tisochrysis_lutea.AAC.1
MLLRRESPYRHMSRLSRLKDAQARPHALWSPLVLSRAPAHLGAALMPPRPLPLLACHSLTQATARSRCPLCSPGSSPTSAGSPWS